MYFLHTLSVIAANHPVSQSVSDATCKSFSVKEEKRRHFKEEKIINDKSPLCKKFCASLGWPPTNISTLNKVALNFDYSTEQDCLLGDEEGSQGAKSSHLIPNLYSQQIQREGR